jgi:hypothetical protein
MAKVHRVVPVRAARVAATDDVEAGEGAAARAARVVRAAKVKAVRVNAPRPEASTLP